MPRPLSTLMYVVAVFFFPFLSAAQELEKESMATNDKKCLDLYGEAERVFSQNLDSAALYINDALDCFKSNEDGPNYVKCLNGLTSIYYYKNDFDRYKEYAALSLKEARSFLNDTHIQYADALNNSYLYFYNQGNFEKSIELIQEALRIKELNKAPKIEIAFFYQNLGNSLRLKGAYEQALEYMEKALEYTLDSLPEDHHRIAEIYDNMALIHRADDRIEEALVFHTRSLEILEKKLSSSNNRIFNLTIKSLQWISELWTIKGDLAKAKYYINKTLNLQKEEAAYRKYFSYELWSQVLVKEKKYPAALAQLQRAEAIATQYDKRNTPPFIARRYLKMAEVFVHLNQTDAALEKYQLALQVLSPGFENNNVRENPPATQIFDEQDALNILQKKAETLWAIYQSKQEEDWLYATLDAYLTAAQLIQNIRQSFLTVAAKNDLAQKTISIYEGAIQCALVAYEQTQETSFLEKAFSLAESNKASLLLESINEQAAKGIAGLPDSLLEREKEWKLNLAYLQKSILENKAKDEATKAMEDQLFTVKQKLEKLTRKFEKEYPRYFESKYQDEPIPMADLQKELATSKSVLLEYFVGEAAIYLFTLSGTSIDVQKLDNLQELMEATAALRELVNTPPRGGRQLADFERFTQTGHFLYTQLLERTLSALPADHSTLIIIPDHELNYIPFELLIRQFPTGKTPGFALSKLEYVLEDFTVSYDYSARLYIKNQQREKQKYKQDFIGFAPSFKNPEYIADSRDCTAEELYNLKCSGAEVQAIGRLLGGREYVDTQADRNAFETEAKDFRIIHLATHACVDENDPMFNKIFLADNYLSNYDLYNLDLQAELAVLSACNTGSGKLIKGEGVMSLARGFMTAGCGSTVMSMWSVNDCATSEIMLYFYRQLEKGLPKNEALRQAKITYLQSVEKSKTHPYYWAAFVQFGNVEKIVFSSSFKGYYYLVIPIVLFLLAYLYRLKKT